jgi:hypothetical protein
MKRFLMVLLLALLPIAKAQTLEFSAFFPLSAQVAISGVPISEVLSFGFAASLERLKISSNAVLDIAPIGTAQASLGLEWAYVGRVRVLALARATLGSASLSLGAAFWNAAPAHFDGFEMYAPDPLPNSTSGSRIDFGLGLRISRSVSLFGNFRFGSDNASNALQLRYRSGALEAFAGVFTGSQLASTVYLLQLGTGFEFEDAGLLVSISAGLGFLNSNFAFETQLGVKWALADELGLSLNLAYQPWRSDVLPLRGSLEFNLSPGFGTVFLTGFAGLNSVNTFNWGVRLTYRISFEELFPA